MLNALLFNRFPENSCYLMDKVVLLRLKFVNCLLDYEKLLDIEGKYFVALISRNIQNLKNYSSTSGMITLSCTSCLEVVTDS